jgi:uncharacterized protein YkwD
VRPVRTAAAASGLVLLTVVATVAWPAIGSRPAVTTEVARAGQPTGPAGPTSPTSPTMPPSAEVAEHAFAVALNRRRETVGLRLLASDPALTAMARAWSAHMAATEKLAHNPNLTTEAPAGWHKLGENVGVGISVAAVHVAFLRSPEHYRNIVDPGFDRVGIGVVVKGRIIWVTVDFEQPQ